MDAVDICLPTDLHMRFALAAIGAGKHVFCEKPLALTKADGKKIAQAARQAGVFFQVGQCIRFWPEYMALEAFVMSFLYWGANAASADRAVREKAAEILARQIECARHLGIDTILAIPGAVGVDFIPGSEIVRYDPPSLARVASVIRRIQPDIILTQSPQDYMEDHQNTTRLVVTQGMDAYLSEMERMSREVGRMSGKFEFAEGWRRHSHPGFASEEFDPLCDFLHPSSFDLHDNPFGLRLSALMISKRIPDSSVPMSLLAITRPLPLPPLRDRHRGGADALNLETDFRQD